MVSEFMQNHLTSNLVYVTKFLKRQALQSGKASGVYQYIASLKRITTTTKLQLLYIHNVYYFRHNYGRNR